MSDIACDECGTTPYLSPATGDHEFDVEMWCDCPESIPIEFEEQAFCSDRPDNWGESGERFTCYRFGSIPVIDSSVMMNGGFPETTYYTTCDCNGTSVGFGLRGVMPDAWKDDMDSTKWEDHYDEIKQVIEDEGPLTLEEIVDRVDLDPAGIECQVVQMNREQELRSESTDDGRKYMTPNMYYDRDDDGTESDDGGLMSMFQR